MEEKQCVTIHWRCIEADQRSSGRDMRHTSSKATASASSPPAILQPPCAWPTTQKLRLEDIPERVQRGKAVSANEDVTFTRLEKGPHHDGVRFANGAEVSLQELGRGVKGYLYNALLPPIWMSDTAEAL
jgi:hypothetical protein